MKLSSKLLAELNKQYKIEVHSAFLYRHMAIWANAHDLPGLKHWMEHQYQEELKHAEKIYHYINERNADLLRLADLVIVPLCASPNDLRALAKTLPILAAAGKPYVFALTRVNPQARLTVQTVMALSEHGPVLQPALRERVAYPASMIDGRTAQELDPKGPAGQEITELWINVKRRLDDRTK